jgi:hypothetical protein
MADQDKKPAGAKNKKKIYGRYAKGMAAGRITYKSKVAGLEDNTFDVGAASDPAKFSKLLKNIDTTEYEEGHPQLLDQAKEAVLAML